CTQSRKLLTRLHVYGSTCLTIQMRPARHRIAELDGMSMIGLSALALAVADIGEDCRLATALALHDTSRRAVTMIAPGAPLRRRAGGSQRATACAVTAPSTAISCGVRAHLAQARGGNQAVRVRVC